MATLTVASGAFGAELTKGDVDALAARLKKLDDAPLCVEAGRVSRNTDPAPRAQRWADMVLAKVKSNGWMDDREIGSAREHRLFIGMSTCAAIAAIGRPHRVNNTTYPQGKLSQWVYEREGRSNRYLHFVDNQLRTFDD